MPAGLRLGVPLPGQRLFFGDRVSAAAYEAAIAQFAGLGVKIVEFDIEPFYAAARLLYEGPWVAERYLTVRALIASSPESLHPVTRQILLAGAHGTSADAFAAFYQLEELRRVRDHTFRGIEAHAAADDADDVHRGAGAGRSDRAQQPARHLHEFRQSARHVRACGAGQHACRWHPVRRHAAGAGRQGAVARGHRP